MCKEPNWTTWGETGFLPPISGFVHLSLILSFPYHLHHWLSVCSVFLPASCNVPLSTLSFCLPLFSSPSIGLLSYCLPVAPCHSHPVRLFPCLWVPVKLSVPVTLFSLRLCCPVCLTECVSVSHSTCLSISLLTCHPVSFFVSVCLSVSCLAVCIFLSISAPRDEREDDLPLLNVCSASYISGSLLGLVKNKEPA